MVVQSLVRSYHNILATGDARSADLPLVRNPVYVICAAVLYLLMITVGPKLMEKRNAFQLQNVLIGYNFFSVALSLWMTYEFFVCSFYDPNFNVFCQDVVESDQLPMTMRLVRVHWVYFFSKLIEFADTFFFVVRKKNNQISFLHCYHHVSMLGLQWMLVKYVPGGVSYFGPLCNCFIHTLMYSYYMLSAFGPHMQKYLWWKRYLTKMQMIQFVFIIVYVSNSLRIGCKYWHFFLKLHIAYLLSLLFLFGQFYVRAYIDAKQKREKRE